MSNHRYILAAVYTADEAATHVLFEVSPFDLEPAERAAHHVVQFEAEFENFLGPATLTTGSTGGEYVLNCIPEELEEWLSGRPDSVCEDAILLPRELAPVIEKVLDRWREDDFLRWSSCAARLKCGKKEVHVEVEAKNTADCYLWTRDVAPIFAALRADFETPEFSTHGQGN